MPETAIAAAHTTFVDDATGRVAIWQFFAQLTNLMPVSQEYAAREHLWRMTRKCRVPLIVPLIIRNKEQHLRRRIAILGGRPAAQKDWVHGHLFAIRAAAAASSTADVKRELRLMAAADAILASGALSPQQSEAMAGEVAERNGLSVDRVRILIDRFGLAGAGTTQAVAH